ncbi:hypothetical protein EYV94_15995 [Puteibacter caeruleilacunae]|nr:hypothetical protein EYV94_15995 [Puteibacter caeruleilacunae]
MRRILMLTLIFLANFLNGNGVESFEKQNSDVFAILNTTTSNETHAVTIDEIKQAAKSRPWGLKVSFSTKVNHGVVIYNNHRSTVDQFFHILDETPSDHTKYIPLFISYNGDSASLVEIIPQLYREKIIYGPIKSKHEKHLWQVIYALKKAKSKLSYCAIEHLKFYNVNASPVKSHINDTLSYGLYIKDNITKQHEQFGNEIEFISKYNDIWRSTGIQPAYIEVNEYSPSFKAVMNALKNSPVIYGQIQQKDDLIRYIHWKEYPNCITNKYFSFPIVDTRKGKLTPFLPGYDFSPKTAVYTGKHAKQEQSFTITPKKITDNLVSYYKFNHNIKDEVSNNHGKRLVGATFKTETDSATYLFLPRGDFLELAPVKNYNLKENSFTISTKIKIEYFYSDYQAIVCSTGRQYRKGLQIALRNQKPYFGFWNLDMFGKTTIRPGQWYNLVCRYNKPSGEMAIFLNGQLEAKTFNVPAFMGDGDLIVARSSDGHELNGNIDDLMLWDRALGDFEIESLYVNPTICLRNKDISQTNLYLILAIIILLGTVTYFLRTIILQSRSKRKLEEQETTPISVNRQQKEQVSKRTTSTKAIHLFGEFQILDQSGINQAVAFTPRIKNLFIVILLHSLGELDGIQSSRLSELIWPDHSRESAMNNRRVNIARLKKTIDKIEGIELLTTNKKYLLQMGPGFYLDYLDFQQIIDSKNFTQIKLLMTILKRGVFLQGINAQWADKVKATISEEIQDFLSSFIKDDQVNDKSKYEAANIILMNDSINEDALTYKIQHLQDIGKNSLAKITYEQFTKEYKIYFGEEYSGSLQQFLK